MFYFAAAKALRFMIRSFMHFLAAHTVNFSDNLAS